MAKAEIVEIPPVVVSDKIVRLELTMEEAQTIFDVISTRIVGSQKSRRRHIDEIYYALREAGIDSSFKGDLSSNMLVFKDEGVEA
jgi:hypothetical protein